MEEKQQCSSCKYKSFMTLSCLIGILLSAYAAYVEIQTELNHNYKPMCDISPRVSCTKVFSTRYGKGFGLIAPIFGEESMFNVPNGFLGIFSYATVIFLSFINSLDAAKIQVILCFLSNVLSIYLAYLLYILDDLCVVCISTYIVNITILFVAWKRYQQLKKDRFSQKYMSAESSKKVN